MKKVKVYSEEELARIKKSRFRIMCLLIGIDVVLLAYLVIEIIMVFAKK